MTYKEAVELAKNNNEVGYNYLYQSTYKEKLFIALKYMKNENDAMDVLQDSYVKAFSKLDTLIDTEKFPSWLGMIVANTAKNALQKNKPLLFSGMASENDEGEIFEYQIEDDNTSIQPELAFSEKETKELVSEMISSLSEEQKMCVLMFHIEGFSIKEIAESLNCSENTVKSRLNYGRKNIKIKAEELQKKGYKLYGAAPIPLLLYLLKSEKALTIGSLANSLMAEKIANKISSDLSYPSWHKNVATKVAETAGKSMRHGLFHTAVGKAVAAITAVVIAGGATAGVIAYRNYGKKNNSTHDAAVLEDTNSQPTTEETVKELDINDALNAYQEYVDKANYNQMYFEQTGVDGKFYYEFAYVDDDDIPELFVVLKNPPQAMRSGSAFILTYNGKEVDGKGALGIAYMPRTGKIYLSIPPAHCQIYNLKDSKFTEIGNGGPTWDENDSYKWKEKTISRNRYDKIIAKYIDLNEAEWAQGRYKSFAEARLNFEKN